MLSSSLALLLLASSTYAQSQSTTAANPTSAAASTQAGAAPTTTAVAAIPTASVDRTVYTTVTGTPPLSALTSGFPTTVLPLPTTYAAGAQPSLAGAPPLPSYAFVPGAYPPQDLTPPTNTPEVQAWLSAIDFSKVPNLPPNVAGGCAANTAVPASACWWSCGQCTRSTDIVTCPTVGTWGLSFDDGPSNSSLILLNKLAETNTKATFFIIGSRALGLPDILRYEHMIGHQISVHTWSHPLLTTLTNEQVVAELGWSRKLIKDMTGITPLTFRPPQGDIDDRVRAIANQMQLQPIMWSSVSGSTGSLFDTGDFIVNSGVQTGQQAFNNWKTFLDTNLPKMTTGFISLEHDLFPVTVALATYYIIPDALSRSNLRLQSVVECQGRSMGESYLETAKNLVFAAGINGSSGVNTASASAGSPAATGTGASRSSTPIGTATAAGASSTTTARSGAERVSAGAIGAAVVAMAVWAAL